MSDAEFKKINKLYSEREKLASDLANELYAPEMEELNTELVNTVIAGSGIYRYKISNREQTIFIAVNRAFQFAECG